MNDVAILQNCLFVGAVLFGLGVAGFLTRRNLIVMFLCAEMMLQGVSLSLIGWGRFHNDWGGQMMVVFIIAVAACEAGVALALVMMLCQRSGDLDVASWQGTREDGIAPYVDTEIPEDFEPHQHWPELTPAGIRPAVDPEKEMFRSHV
ncbi:MAG: NADH-quinone oxidoreductase subunit NuoK [Pirellulaceae bacterium]